MATSVDVAKRPHIAVVPSAGSGHMTSMVRLAAALSMQGCKVTFLVPSSTVSTSESALVHQLLSAHPDIQPIELPLDPSSADGLKGDPFVLQWGVIARAAQLLPSLLAAASPLPFSAVIVDISLINEFAPVAKSMGLPTYCLFVSSSLMLALCAAFPALVDSNSIQSSDDPDIHIPGLPPLSKAWLPPVLHNPQDPFTVRFLGSARSLHQLDGILINIFESFDQEILAALNTGSLLPGLPPVLSVGPLQPVVQTRGSPIPWLDAQPDNSVVYLSTGSRTAMKIEQIKEVAMGLELSGCKFLWALKSKIVDKDEDSSLEELLGEGYLERVKDRGFVTNGWVDQEEVLTHRATGGFLSHAGWCSVMEAATHGVPMLGWPPGGDQFMNAVVMEKSGMGVWVDWACAAGKDQVVRADAIAAQVRKLMGDDQLREAAARVSREGAAANAPGGSSDRNFKKFISALSMQAM